MILVTVGMHDRGFDRLVQPTDELASRLDEPVIIQRGSGSYLPRHADAFQFTTSRGMTQLAEAARIVVSHAAAGSIILCLRCKTPLVVVPRLRHYGESIDDHQLQLARALHDSGRAIAVFDPSPAALLDALELAFVGRSRHAGPEQLVLALRDRLRSI